MANFLLLIFITFYFFTVFFVFSDINRIFTMNSINSCVFRQARVTNPNLFTMLYSRIMNRCLRNENFLFPWRTYLKRKRCAWIDVNSNCCRRQREIVRQELTLNEWELIRLNYDQMKGSLIIELDAGSETCWVPTNGLHNLLTSFHLLRDQSVVHHKEYLPHVCSYIFFYHFFGRNI